MRRNHFVESLDRERNSVHSIQKDSPTSSEESTLRTLLFNCLDFHDFSWLSLNNLLYLTHLESASTSASNLAVTGVPVNRAIALAFRLRVSPGASTSGSLLISTGLTWCRYYLKIKPDVGGWLLILRFEFEMWESENQKLARFLLSRNEPTVIAECEKSSSVTFPC